MPDFSANVLPLSQDADFFLRLAQKKRQGGHYQEAVALLRRAETTSEFLKNDHLMELAELYSEMGCPIESNRYLIRILAGNEPDPACYFALACNLFTMGNVDGAQAAALLYLEAEPNGEYREQAAGMMSAVQYAEEINRPGKRHERRCYRLNARAAMLLNSDRPQAAARLVKQSLAIQDTPQTQAFYAFTLLEAGRTEQAAVEAELLLDRRGLNTESLLYALRVLSAAGYEKRALELLRHLESKDPDDYEQRRLLESAMLLQSQPELENRLNAAIRRSPYDRTLLHNQAAFFLNKGNAEAAADFWRKMLEINPTDPLALIYLRALREGLSAPIPIEAKLSEALASEIGKRLETMDPDDEDTLLFCRWALIYGDEQSALRAAEILSRCSDRESEMVLRDALIEPTLPYVIKLYVRDALVKRGASKPYFTVTRCSFSRYPGLESHDRSNAKAERTLHVYCGAAMLMGERVMTQFLDLWADTEEELRLLMPDVCAAALLYEAARLCAIEKPLTQSSKALNRSKRYIKYCLSKYESQLRKDDKTR